MGTEKQDQVDYVRQHKKEELWWRGITKWLAKEAGRVGRSDCVPVPDPM